MKPKWHRGKVNFEGNYKVRVRNIKGEMLCAGADCDAYNLSTITGALKSSVGLLLAKGESGEVLVTDPNNNTKICITVAIAVAVEGDEK